MLSPVEAGCARLSAGHAGLVRVLADGVALSVEGAAEAITDSTSPIEIVMRVQAATGECDDLVLGCDALVCRAREIDTRTRCEGQATLFLFHETSCARFGVVTQAHKGLGGGATLVDDNHGAVAPLWTTTITHHFEACLDGEGRTVLRPV